MTDRFLDIAQVKVCQDEFELSEHAQQEATAEQISVDDRAPRCFEWVAEETALNKAPLAKTQRTPRKISPRPRVLSLSDLCVLSERSERAREQHFAICGQDFVTHSKRRRAIITVYPLSRSTCHGRRSGRTHLSGG
jgi:hypothetical protein